MSQKSTKQNSFDQAIKKSMGKRAWGNLSVNDRIIVRDFAKLEKMGGPVGSGVPEEYRRTAQQA